MLWSRGLMSLWRLENTALDGSGNGNHGTVHGANYTNGKFGRALDFAGGIAADRVTVAHHPSLNPTTGLTFAAWIYPHSSGGGGFGRIVQKSTTTAGAAGYIWCVFTGDKLILLVNTASGSVTNTALAYNEWQHVAVTVDGSNPSNVIHYRNGAADGTGTTNPLATLINTADLLIGNRLTDLARCWDGVIDELQIFNRVLTPQGIQRVMMGLPPIG